ncbi:luxQ [Symbiodinium natans]|uniref:LuxQ protein n=1 Tax=Symbiodinium natans TaxID=878477 RepID=A0A812TJK3_9DINO|nr:luxQ [Symbiodinium natans]
MDYIWLGSQLPLVDGLAFGTGTPVLLDPSSFWGHHELESYVSSGSSSSSALEPAPCTGVCKRCRSSVDRRQMAAEGLRAFRASEKGGPRPQRLPDRTWVTAKYWGIRQDQIEELFDLCQMEPDWYDECSVHDFVNTFVKPATRGTEMGYALMLNQEEPQQVTIMISHAWVENTRDFFQDVLSNTWAMEVAFICFLSNFQGTPEQINAQLGNNIMKSPFTEVISSSTCQRMLVVPNEALRESGQGLYSRLWCIWEIKVAADAGLPIMIVPRKSDEEYLLGTSTMSSKNARCGNPELPMNKDERLIRAAIDNLPPQSARSRAVGFFLVCFSVSYGACIGASLMKDYSGLLAGVGGGLCVGMFFMACIAQGVRKCVWKLRDRDGYHILDKVIRGSAMGAYAWRRISVDRDVLPLVVTCLLFAAVFMFWRYALSHNPLHIPVAATEGMGVALLLFFMFQVNLLGMLHGNFFIFRRTQLLATTVLFSCATAGSIIGWKSTGECDGMIGLGANLGFLSGVLIISTVTQHWVHALANMLMIGIMLLARYLSPILWREYFLILCGSIGLLVLPDWRHWQRGLMLLIALSSLLGLEMIYLLFDRNSGYDVLFCRSNMASIASVYMMHHSHRAVNATV